MNEQKNFREMIQELQASSDLLRTVSPRVMEQKTYRKGCKKMTGRVLSWAAAALALLLGGNGICYSVSGKTLLDTVTVWINGKAVEKEAQWSVVDGVLQGNVELSAGDGVIGSFTFYPDEAGETELIPITYRLVRNRDRIYLEESDGREGVLALIDITDQFAQGRCHGVYQSESKGSPVMVEYSLWVTEDSDWNLSISSYPADSYPGLSDMPEEAPTCNIEMTGDF